MGLAVDGDVSRQASRVERRIRALNGSGAEGPAGIARFLLFGQFRFVNSGRGALGHGSLATVLVLTTGLWPRLGIAPIAGNCLLRQVPFGVVTYMVKAARNRRSNDGQ